jgi:putative MATE family efflux protein
MKAINLSDHFTYRKLLLFAMPTIGMILISITYDVVDGYFTSNYIGKTAFSAVNIVYPFQLLLSMVGYMFGAGGSALIASQLGNGDTVKANQYFTMIVRVALAVGLVLAVLGMILLPWVASLIGATPEILKYGVPYGRTLFLFLPIMIVGYAFQSLLITAEKPQFGFYLSIANLISNLVFDYLFIVHFGWGMIGAAVATGIGACLNGLVPLIYFSRPNSSQLRFVKCRTRLKPLLQACSNGASEMVNDMATSFIFVLYNYQLLRLIGENGVAAYGVIIFVEGIFASFFYGFAMEATTVVGYNYGAKNYPELKSLLRKGNVLNFGFGILMTVLCMVCASMVAQIYVGYDEEVYRLSVHAMQLYAFAFLFQGFNEYSSAYFTGLNNGKVSAIIAFSKTFIIQTAAILLLPLFFGIDGLWLSQAVAEFVACIVGLYFYITHRHEYTGVAK